MIAERRPGFKILRPGPAVFNRALIIFRRMQFARPKTNFNNPGNPFSLNQRCSAPFIGVGEII